jgi:two-component system response regulator HydG
VSATNKDLKGMIERKEFRSDLYYRINGSEVKLPPLRERREDIPRVVRHAIVRAAENLAKAQGRPTGQAAVPDITDPALMRLTQYSWPGNVRQLLNVVENMVVMASGEPVAPGQPIKLDVRHIPDDVRLNDDDPGEGAGAGAAGSLAGSTLEQLEKRAIRETLRLTGGNREQAAQMLGLGERTLYRKLKDYGLR